MRLPWAAVIMLAFVAGPGHGRPTPVEVPADSFSGRQYIDSAGCVFLRDGEGLWQARLDPAGKPVCGYPSTPLARAPQASASSPADWAPEGMNPTEARLLREVAGSMQRGELAAAATAPAPSVADSGSTRQGADDEPGMPPNLIGHLEAAIVAAPRVAGAAAATALRDSNLCELVGARPPQGTRASMMGYCGASIIAQANHGRDWRSPPLLLADTASVTTKEQTPAKQAAGEDTAARASGKGTAKAVVARRESPAQRQTTTSTPPRLQPDCGSPPASGAAPGVPMAVIPAGARYFMISRHPSRASAQAAAQRLAQAGFPAAITAKADKGGPRLLAGPFNGREAMVRARQRLLTAGFTPQGAH